MKKNVLKMFAKKSVAILGIMSVMLVGLAGCGKEETPQTDIQDTPVVDETTEPTEEVKQPEVEVETEVEVEVESEVESTEEAEVPEETMEEWLTEMGTEGICLAVWNESNGTKRLMAEGEEYVKVAGDRIFACGPSLISRLNISSVTGATISRLSENCVEVLFADSKEDDKVTTIITCKDGEEFTINFVIIAGESLTSETEVAGYDWAKALGYDAPKMVVWNDTTGVKQELDEDATYQLCEGDSLALYMPDNYLFDSANIDGNYIDRGFNIAIVNWKNVELGDKFDFEITIYHSETLETITSHVTLLPIQ